MATNTVNGQRETPNIPVFRNYTSVYNVLDSPKEVGCFSVDAERKIHFDRTLMMYYVPLKKGVLPLDLNVGYEDTVKRQSLYLDEKMEKILKWILRNKHVVFDRDFRPKIDFITHCGTLQNVLCSPYLRGDWNNWIICATKFKGVIYLVSMSTDFQVLKNRNDTDENNRSISWGYKFEQYMTADTPWGVPDVSSITHEIEEFCIAITNRFNGYKLLYKAEVDGMSSDCPDPESGGTSYYVELKTAKRSPTFCSAPPFLKYKSLQWWSQTLIGGMKKTVCGMKDEKGIVTSVEEFETSQLPSMSKYWNPNVCFNFLKDFLNYLKANVVEDDHKVVYKMEYDCPVNYFGTPQVTCTKLRNPENRYKVIPDWYAEELTRKE